MDGYWSIKIGENPNDPDMVEGDFAEIDEVRQAMRKYHIGKQLPYVVIEYHLFTDVNRF